MKTSADVQVAAEDDTIPARSITLRDAMKTVQSVEFQATALLGRVLDGGEGDEKLEYLKSRLRAVLAQEMLDVVKNFVDPPTFQQIKRELVPS